MVPGTASVPSVPLPPPSAPLTSDGQGGGDLPIPGEGKDTLSVVVNLPDDHPFVAGHGAGRGGLMAAIAKGICSAREQLKETETTVTSANGSRVVMTGLGAGVDAPAVRTEPATGTCLHAPMAAMHGWLGKADWAPPLLAAYSDVEARPGYDSCKAHEYLDKPEVLAAKVQILAELIRSSSNCVTYTGAGISTAAGISDYASEAAREAGKSMSGPAHAMTMSPMDSRPTQAHCVLTALHRTGYVKRWIQQNHDGLPQKAGFPQHALNEIHGAWFDPSNPVVKMEGELRSDLFSDLLEWEQKTDLCIAVGTSLAGMNADRVSATVAKRAAIGGVTSDGSIALGTVIISLQQTQMDSSSALRIFARIDDVMTALATELGVVPSVPPCYQSDPRTVPVAGAESQLVARRSILCKQREEDVFRIPYGSDGERLGSLDEIPTEALTILDLREGAMVQITSGPYAGDQGEIVGRSRSGHYQIRFLHTLTKRDGRTWKAPMTHTMGAWMVAEATLGLLERFPIVSVSDETVESEEQVMARQEHLVMQEHFAAKSIFGPLHTPSQEERSSLPDWVKASFLEAKVKNDQRQ